VGAAVSPSNTVSPGPRDRPT